MGILSIATYLKNKNHIVKIIDKAVNKTNYKKALEEFKPDIVGVSVISYKSIEDAIKVSEVAHARNIPVVWGGALASIIPETVLKHGCVDCVIIGEGEITWEILLVALEEKTPLNTVDGLAYIEDKIIRINKDRAFADLADFPILDWSLVNPLDYIMTYFGAKKTIRLYSSKGCPGQCTFCFNKGYNRCEYRKRPFEDCIKEVKYLVENAGVDGVHFVDELWCRNKKEMIENCNHLIASGIKILWGTSSRIGTYEKEDFEYMFNAGCRWMFFGVESGSERIQTEIKKGIHLSKVEETVSNCVNAGITVITSFIIGFPGETSEDIKETIAFAKKIPMAMYDFSLFFPIFGTEMCDKLVMEGKYKFPDTLEEYAQILPTDKMLTNFSEISTKELEVIRAFFMWSSLSRKNTSIDSEKYAFVKKAVSDMLKNWTRLGFKDFIVSFFYDVGIFLNTIFCLMFNPKIRKKYCLYKSKG